MTTMDLRQLEDMLRGNNVVLTAGPTIAPETVSLNLTDERGTDMGPQDISLSTVQQRRVNFVLVYNTRTGEPIPVDTNRLPTMISAKKVHRDPRFPEYVGRIMFTLDKARVPEYRMGVLKCPMHKDAPDAEQYYDLGAEPCKKSNIPNILAVEDHMRKKHPQTYQYTERMRAREIEAEEREFRRAVIAQSTQETTPRRKA